MTRNPYDTEMSEYKKARGNNKLVQLLEEYKNQLRFFHNYEEVVDGLAARYNLSFGITFIDYRTTTKYIPYIIHNGKKRVLQNESCAFSTLNKAKAYCAKCVFYTLESIVLLSNKDSHPL